MKIIQILVLFVTMSAPSWAQTSQPLLVNIRSAESFSDQQYEKLMQAKDLVELIINSAAFKERILNFSYNGVKSFVQNNGMSNQQIYDDLMAGAEVYPTQSSVDHKMDFDLALYKPKFYQSNNVLGYTDQSTSIIHINRNFYNQASVNEIAMNLVHEWVHKMGFDHDFKSTARRPYSVPYAVGYIVRDLGSMLEQ